MGIQDLALELTLYHLAIKTKQALECYESIVSSAFGHPIGHEQPKQRKEEQINKEKK